MHVVKVLPKSWLAELVFRFVSQMMLMHSFVACESVCFAAESTHGVVTSVDANVADGAGSTLAADYTMRNARIDLALAHSRKAVRTHPDEIEPHRALAEALEAKLATQDETDPYLFQQCIQEWLTVYRSEVGEEKGLGFRGVGFGGHLYQDDHAILAKHRLVKIVGRAPKPWETDSRYIKSALKNISVVGKILRSETQPKIATDQKTTQSETR